MSGHSKWAQIKRQKGVADIKRGQAFTKLAGAITIAVRQGGGVGDPNQNFRLRLEIEKARAANMPKDNIERAIERGKGKGDKGQEFAEVVYEGFGPGGIAFIVEAATDNTNRTTPEIKSLIEKNGGTLGTPGSVAYQFQTVGQIVIVKKDTDQTDDIFLAAADAGADDIEDLGNEVIVYTKADSVTRVKDALSQKFQITGTELIRKPQMPQVITNKEVAQKLVSFLDRLESHDDVQKVFSNATIADEAIDL